MNCPKCGYIFQPFEEKCPRCTQNSQGATDQPNVQQPRLPSAQLSMPPGAQRRPATRPIISFNGTVTTGLVLTAIGIVLTVGGYMMAASNPNGGHYLIFWGLIFYGVIHTIRGLFQG